MMKLLFCGDVFWNKKENGDKNLIKDIECNIEESDYFIANLEAPIGNRNCYKPISKTGQNLMANEGVLSFLSAIKVNCVNLANNHVGDYGEKAVIDTIEKLKSKNIAYIGAGDNIESAYNAIRYEKDGISVSIIGSCENEFGIATETRAGVAGYKEVYLLKRIKEEKAKSNHVIVFFHGGNEYNSFPSPYIKARYHQMIDYGASAVIATHTHCPQGYEYYNEGFIAYSMGNFFFPQEIDADDAWNKGYMCQVSLAKNTFHVNIIPYKYVKEKNVLVKLCGDDDTNKKMHVLCEAIKDDSLLAELYLYWTMYLGGLSYSKYITLYSGDEKNNLEIQNIMRCESHKELVKNYFDNVNSFVYGNEEYESKMKMYYQNTRNNINQSRGNMMLVGLENIPDEARRIIVYGSGNVGKLFMRKLKNMYPHAALLYADTYNEGVVDGIIVTNNLEQYAREKDCYFVIGSIDYACEIYERIKAASIPLNKIVFSNEILEKIMKHEDYIIQKRTAKKRMRIVVDIAEHCNLNCAYCDHFSPLADEKYADIEQFERDIKRLSELFVGDYELYQVGLEGGEPLLNPEIEKYIRIVRNILPKTLIKVLTNGTLLFRMKDTFWKTCRENDVEIMVTRYPIHFDYDGAKQKADIENVSLVFWSGGESVKVMNSKPLNLRGDGDKYVNYSRCYMGNDSCTTLKNGRIYLCTVAPNLDHFNKYFNQKIRISSRDYIDIYDVCDASEIMDYLCNPIPACRYCQPDKWIYGYPWKRTTYQMSEWAE